MKPLVATSAGPTVETGCGDHVGMLPELIAARIAAQPDATAVTFGGENTDYATLAARAGSVAGQLVACGVRRGEPVGVCMHRHPDLVAALLGIWWAGAAFVPLDPYHPDDRLAWISADAGVRVVLTDATLRGRVSAAQILVPGEQAGTEPVPEPFVVDAEDAAYVMYTSGSTGRPKGIVIGHGGIANRVLWTVRTHRLGSGDRVLQKTSVGFDAAVWEFFAPLVSGATVALAAPGVERDPRRMIEAIVEQDVTVLQGVPSVLRRLVAEPGWSGCDSLRLVCSAGEPLDGALARALSVGGRAEVWNTYGPTECSIDVTAHRSDPGGPDGPVPIGRPLSGLRILLLEPGGEPVPIGVPGEVHVGGVGLARGYLNRPGPTADRFVPDPFGGGGRRLYRTGDRARWRPDGSLEFLGRLDEQVKVNGVRIEPGEVESCLLGHPAVREAAVLAENQPRGGHLVAHLAGTDLPDAEALRRYLRERIPEAMIPSRFVPHGRFPLNSSGKTDRKALAGMSVAVRERIGPRNPAEELIAEIWCDLLGIEGVGVDDDFFALGATSLDVTRLATRLRARCSSVDLPGLFGTATLAGQAALIGSITPQQPVPDRIERVEQDGPTPLSPGQHRLWFLDRLHPAGPEWVAPLVLRLPGGTDEHAVRRALHLLEERHESLRTRYPVRDGEPGQIVVGAGEVEVRVEQAAADALPRLFAEQFARGFDLATGPLWRALLVEVHGQDPVLLITVHHIASDGWSTAVLERDLRRIVSADPAAELPQPPLRYRDYALWRSRSADTQEWDADLAFWRSELAGATATEVLPDHPRPPRRDAAGAGVAVPIPADLARAVTEFSKDRGTTPFTTLLTALAVLLARQTGNGDVVIGAPVVGRDRPELSEVVGFFLNSVVLRCRLDDDPDVQTALERVKRTCARAFAHQGVPFERLVTELQPQRDLSRTPLYQVAFDLQEEGATTTSTDPILNAAFQQAWKVSKTDLTLFVRRDGQGGLHAAFEYATALFDEVTVDRLAQRYVRLLRAIVTQPNRRISSLEMVCGSEQELLRQWSVNPLPTPPTCVPEQIRAAAALHPRAVAVVCGPDRLGYADLEAASNRIAHHLGTLVTGEQIVSVLLDRGPELIVTLLGIWKAGAAYLPIDPSFPAARVAEMMRTAGSTVAVTSSDYSRRFPDGTRTVVLDGSDRAAIDACPPRPVAVDPDPDRLAYVIFTSGSTGIPKGVAVTHRGLANHIHWAAGELAGRGAGGAPVFSSVAFDLVMPNLWAPLVTGARVWMYPQSGELDQLGAALVEAGGFSFVKLTPSHLELLELQLTPAQLDRLAEVVVVAGEALVGSTAERWRTVLGDGRLINEYGPTEASVGTCVYPVVGPVRTDVVPIGRPLPNLSMYVLDEGLRRVPVGVPGELWVGGTGVARGYVGRPDLSAERFLPDPWGASGARMYRTGDRARVLADGVVDFLGRLDDQVKIRGHRVEPAEVRACLLEHPAVRDAVVVADGPVTDRRLLAYYVPTDAAAVDAAAVDAAAVDAAAVDAAAVEVAADLVGHCAGRLPAYLVPSAVLALGTIPLTANGKLDQAALPAPGPVGVRGRTGPQTPAQERVAQIWAEVLGCDLDQVDVHTGFFAVGGHSIRAVQLVAELRSAFGVQLAIRTVFERPTVAELAEEIEAAIRAQIEQMPVADLLDQLNDPVDGGEH